MLRLFKNTDYQQDSLSAFFIMLDYLDPAQHPERFDRLKCVNSHWRDAVNDYHDRLAISLAILSQCDLFKQETPHTLVRTSRFVGGMTNKTIFFQVKNDRYVARLPGKQTSAFISRAHEAHNIRVADQLGIAAALIFDRPDGVQVTQFLPQPEAMTPKSLTIRRNITLCMQPLKRLHAAPARFGADTDVFDRNKRMLAILETRDITPDSAYQTFNEAMVRIEKLLSPLTIQKVPCHNDTTPSNFIKYSNEMDSNDEIKLIDWEYSNNNDPLWDLAFLSIEAKFNAAQDTAMLEDYFGSYDIEKYHRLILYKAVVEYWVVLWAEVQIANRNYSSEAGLAVLRDMVKTRKESCFYWLNHADFKAACASYETKEPPVSYCSPR